MAIVSDIEIRLMANIAQLRQEMEQARQSVGGAMNGIRDSVNTATKALGALAVGMAAGAFAGWIKGAIDATDAVSDISQRTGIAIKDIAGLQLWFQKGGTEASAFEGAMIKLSRKIAEGGDEFSKLGIKTRDANGGLRTNVDVLLDSADAFAAMQDGTAKTAMAVDLFGKSGAELIPLLNEGSEGLREMNEMAEKLGLTFDQKTVDAAGEFNDTLDFLGLASQGVARQVAAQLLPALNSLVGSMLEFITTGNGVRQAADVIGTGFKLIYTAGVLISQTFSVAGKTIGMLAAQLVSLFQLNFKEAMNIGHAWQADMKETFSSTAKTISDVWTGAGGDVVQALVTSTNAGTVASNQASKDAKKQADAYGALIESIQAKVMESQREADGVAKLTESQKMALSLDNQIRDGKLMMTAAEEGFARALIETLGANEMTIEANARAKASADQVKKAVDELNAARQKELEDAVKQADAAELAVATYGKTKSAIEELEVVRLQARINRAADLELDEKDIAQTQALIEAKQRAATANKQIEGLEEAKKAGEELNKFFDESKAETFGDTLSKAFGRAGSAMGQLTTTFQSYANKQLTFEKQSENLEKKHSVGQRDQKAYLADLTKLEKQRFTAQLGGYGDMAGAAAGFFDEQSKGYKVLNGVSQAFHAAELASTIAELVPKGISAILGQGQGDPYTALPRMAAMAAFVAALGVSVGGGGGGASMSVSQQRQQSQGRGGVLGDNDARSESLAKALEMVEDNTYRNLSVNYEMLSALRNIESSLSGLGNLIVRSTGINGDLPADIMSSAEKSFNKIFGMGSLGEKLTGGLTGKIIGSIFGGKVTALDGGLTANAASIASIMAGGLQASQYTDTKKSGGWFSSDKYRTQLQSVGAEVNDQFSKVILSMVDGIKASASVLGLSGDEFTQRLNSFVVDIGKISLTGLKGDEIQKALEAVFSKAGDSLANFAVQGLAQFQKVGEGTYETLVRIANDYATIDAVLSSFGKSFGAVGLASVAARENLIELSGGLDEFTSQGSFFLENFFSAAEKEATLRTAVYAQLDKVTGGSAVKTIAQFKELVLAQDLTTQSGRDAYASLMSVSQAFVDLTKFGEEAAEKAKELAATRRDLEIQIMELSGDAAGALAAQRQLEIDAADESLRPLIARVHALQDEATQTEKAATKRNMEIRLMEVSGDAAGALAAKRAIELAALDETLRPLQELIYAREDENKAATEAAALAKSRRAVEIQIMELEGNAAGVLAAKRADELAAMDESLRPFYQRLYALQDEKKALDDAKNAVNGRLSALSKAITADNEAARAASDANIAIINARKSAAEELQKINQKELQDRIATRQAEVNKLRDLSSALQSSLSGMGGISRQAGQAQIAKALTSAMRGNFPTADSLADALAAVSQPSQEMFSSFADFQRDMFVTAGRIADLNALTEGAAEKADTELSVAQAALEQSEAYAKEESERYDREIALAQKTYDDYVKGNAALLAAAQREYDMLAGTYEATLDVATAIRQFNSSMLSAGGGMLSSSYTQGAVYNPTQAAAGMPSSSSVSGSVDTLSGRMDNVERMLGDIARTSATTARVLEEAQQGGAPLGTTVEA